MGLKKFMLVLFLMISLDTFSQEIPPLQNFSPLDYRSGNQNWDLSQSAEGNIFIANNDGLLEFDGATWTRYPSPNETIIRSVNVIDDRIYTGCYMEFGYWQRNDLGELDYHSITRDLGIEPIEDEEFWKIIGISEWVIFQSLKRIYLYNTENQKVSVIDSDEVINKMFELDEDIYFQRLNQGIFHIENGADNLLISDAEIKGSEVIAMFPSENEVLIITRNNGFYLYNDEILEPHENDFFKGLGIYSAIQTRSNQVILGTISHGLIVLDQRLNPLYEIDQSNGLNNNTVLSLFEDKDNNIWAGLDNGVCCMNLNAPIKIFRDTKGILGSVYASIIFDGNLYLGTNQGLFMKRFDDETDFQLLEGTQGQVWCIEEIRGELFCGHDQGTFLIDGEKVTRVSNVQGTWNIDQIDGTDLLIQGNYDGLYILENVSGRWQLKNKIDGFNNSSRYFEVLHNQIFVNHEYKGVFRLTVDSSFSRVEEAQIDTLLKEANSSISSYQQRIIYVNKEGVFHYNESTKMFELDSLLSSSFSEEDYISGRVVLDEARDNFWLFTRTNLVLITTGNLSSMPRINKIPLSLEVRRAVSEHENIISISDEGDEYLLGTSSGYMIINIDQLSVTDFNILVKKISLGINEDHSATENLLNKSLSGDFDSDENNLLISYHTPKYYQYFTPSYQYRLEGLYHQWSEWTAQSYVFFENIPPGNYTFQVRSKVGNKISENIARYDFNISKPWYATDIMIVIYLIAIISLTYIIHQTYRKYYHNQREKIVEKNRKEMELKMLQNEREIIKLKNEQLEKGFKMKSSEASASAMSIVKKNELLMQIKEQLAHIDDNPALRPVVRIIDDNLNHDENWKLFKKAFENSDSDFFKKIKETHPDLSPNDLKLCAYLRLNLSSKEIAPLFNISPRSVEIKRYRLRQKMNLDTNENLTEYILKV